MDKVGIRRMMDKEYAILKVVHFLNAGIEGANVYGHYTGIKRIDYFSLMEKFEVEFDDGTVAIFEASLK